MNAQIVLFGASGHAKVVIDILERQGRKVLCLIDDDPKLKNTNFFGYLVAGGRDAEICMDASVEWLVAIGNNRHRQEVANWLENSGRRIAASAVHPSAQIGRMVSIGNGTVVMAGAVINPGSSVDAHCIVNTASSIDHDCLLGYGVHIAPGARLCGGVAVGAGTLVGAGAVVCPNLLIGKNVVVGAGSTVLENVPSETIVVGSPAREIDK